MHWRRSRSRSLETCINDRETVGVILLSSLRLNERWASCAYKQEHIDITGDAAEELVRWIQSKGRRSMAVQGDVSERTAVESMIDKVWDEFGHIDILVNNAGIETIVPSLEITDQQWTRVTDVDLRGPWPCSQVFCRRVVADGPEANIVNIGSIQAAPAKLAIEALTRNTSAEMTPPGTRVNCVHPGFIATDMTSWILKDPAIFRR